MQREFIFTDKWLEIVFKNRNRAYGAYVLRKHLHRNILIGYLAALLFMGTVIFTGYQFSKISIKDIKGIIDELPPGLVYEIPPDTPTEAPNTDPVPKTDPPKTSTEEFIPVVKDSVIDSEKKDDRLPADANPILNDTSGIGDKNKFFGGEPGLPVESYDTLPIYKVEKRPEFPGGESAMIRFIQKNTHIPREYMREEITKTVYISFIVDSTGKVCGIKPEKNLNDYPKFVDEAISTVTKMPRWQPGQQNGRNVPVIMTLPIKFTVKNDF